MDEPMAPAAGEVSRALRSALQANADVVHALSLQLGIGHSDLAALDYLVTAPSAVGTVELGHRLGMRSASATVLVDRLERAGHLARLPHPDDRRRIQLVVTPGARQELLAALAPLIAGVEQLAAQLTPADARTTAGFLRAVAELFRTFAEAADRPLADRPGDPS